MARRRRFPGLKEDKGFEAFPAVVVADKTDKVGKRLAWLGVGLLILFFATSTYVQSAKNGGKLDAADSQRRKLIESIDRLTRKLDNQDKTIHQLQTAINIQNGRLLAAGLPTVPLPGQTASPVTPRPTSHPTTKPRPRHRPTHRPTTKPTPKPTPQPTGIPIPTVPPIPPIPVPTLKPTASPTPNALCRIINVCP